MLEASSAVHILNPFAITGALQAAFNPLDESLEAAALADALVHDAGHEFGEVHRNEEAKALIAGLLLFIASEELRASRTWRGSGASDGRPAPDEFLKLLERMQTSSRAAGLRPARLIGIWGNRIARPPAFSRQHSGTRTFSTHPE